MDIMISLYCKYTNNSYHVLSLLMLKNSWVSKVTKLSLSLFLYFLSNYVMCSSRMQKRNFLSHSSNSQTGKLDLNLLFNHDGYTIGTFHFKCVAFMAIKNVWRNLLNIPFWDFFKFRIKLHAWRCKWLGAWGKSESSLLRTEDV